MIQDFQAYPRLYSWTTFPLTTLLKQIFEQQRAEIIAGRSPDPVLVDLCSVIERGINYMHTGNAAVIATSVMNPLWIGQALIQDGIPCLNPKVVNTLMATYITICHEHWPYDETFNLPKCSSRKAQVTTYGEAHYNVSHILLSYHLHVDELGGASCSPI